MTTPETNWVCVDPETGKEDHNWTFKSDWEGDPGVIGGTRNLYYRKCEECGKEEPCDAEDMPQDDYDDYQE